MFCRNCGKQLAPQGSFCNNCGFNNQVINNPTIPNNQNKKNTTRLIAYGMGGVSIFLFTIIIMILVTGNSSVNISSDDYTVDSNENCQANNTCNNTPNTITYGDFKTVIEHETGLNEIAYSKVDAISLIEKYAKQQEETCYKSNSKQATEIKKIENEIKNKYGISAVNLCELNLDFARESEKVLGKIYSEFPMLRNKIVNLTIGNFTGDSKTSTAYFMVMPFSPISQKYPLTLKTMIGLNTRDYLNLDRFKITMERSVQAEHFPSNATIYSPLAHEYGHYLVDLVRLAEIGLQDTIIMDSTNENKIIEYFNAFRDDKYDEIMVREAYNNYQSKYNDNITIDQFKRSISIYATTKYGETMAEAFHDYYLNGNNASKASLEIMEVLKKYLNKWYR